MTAVALSTLGLDTLSVDLVAGGTSVTATNDAVIAAGSKPGKLLLAFYFASTGTVTLKAGANPPGQRADMGASSAFSVTGGTVKCLAIDAARYAQANGTILATIGTNTAVVTALQLSEAV